MQLQEVSRVLGRNVEWFRGGVVFKAHGLLYHSTLGVREIKKKKVSRVPAPSAAVEHAIVD